MISYLRSSCLLSNISDQVLEALDIAFEAIDKDDDHGDTTTTTTTITAVTVTQEHDRPIVANANSSATASSSAAAAPVTPSAITTTTNFDQLISESGAMDGNDKDIEQFIDDLIKQTDEKDDVANCDQPISTGATVVDVCTAAAAAAAQEQLIDALVDEPVEPTIEPVVIEEKRIVFEMTADPIYEIIEDVSQPKPLKSALKSPNKKAQASPKEEKVNRDATPAAADVEPYYEVPNRKPIPLYENVDIFLASVNDTNQGQLLSTIPAGVNLQPPKVKPPPPPVESEVDSDGEDTDDVDVVENETPEENLKRMNSTKRIKKDIRNKRSSFLGIESSQDDELDLKLTIAPPPDMSALIEEERRLEKQFLKTYDGVGELFRVFFSVGGNIN